MSLGYGVVQLDVTIVNTALSSIGAALGGGGSELHWVVSAAYPDETERSRAVGIWAAGASLALAEHRHLLPLSMARAKR